MYDDISHTELADLKHRKKTVHVVSSNHIGSKDESGRPEAAMLSCIELFRHLYADDMEECCGLSEGPGIPTEKLPTMTAIALLLNPLYGGYTKITSNNLMTMEQYTHAEEDLIAHLQLMMERDNGVDTMVLHSGSVSFDEEDDPIVTTFSTERARAKREFQQYVNLVKKKKYVPKSYIGTTLKLGTIQMGKVATRGEDIKHPHPFIVSYLLLYLVLTLCQKCQKYLHFACCQFTLLSINLLYLQIESLRYTLLANS
jgi:hypothetical protein